MRKNSLWKKIVELFAVEKHSKFGKSISPEEAAELQLAYISSHCVDKKLPDDPYFEIAKHLTSSREEIFEAALYYLQRIAVNQHKNRTKIVEMLYSISHDVKLPSNNKSLILQTIKNIENCCK